MDFLPLKIKGGKVYAGFWLRFGALFVDILVLAPFAGILAFMHGVSIPMAFAALMFSSILFVAYTVYFHYRFGATIGKMAMDIKVALPDGSAIGLRQALLRSSVDIPLAILLMIAQLIALSKVNAVDYLSAGWNERMEIIYPYFPSWYDVVDVAVQVWTLSELLVLLLNRRKRALHDFIAGTVVIYKEYAKRYAKSERIYKAQRS